MIGSICIYLLIGIFFALLFMAINTLHPGSLISLTPGTPQTLTDYDFYYFSFISITTVGYGDVTPLTQPSQALTLVMNIIGQFYLAIVIAVFVGKYINVKS